MEILSRRAFWVLLWLVLGAASSGAQEPEALPEYVIKAGFLYNFAKYVEWPAEALGPADQPITIAILGPDPFGPDLEKTLHNKTVKNRPFAVIRVAKGAELPACQILFVSRQEKLPLSQVLKQLEGRAVLTVGEEAGFCRSGGTTNILIEKEKPRLEVNPDAAELSRLTINAKLLKVATIVRTEK